MQPAVCGTFVPEVAAMVTYGRARADMYNVACLGLLRSALCAPHSLTLY